MARDRIYIMVDLQPQTAFWRGVISGAARYCVEHAELRLRFPSSEWALIGDNEEVDGVIAVVWTPETYAAPRRFGKPIVNVSSTVESTPFPTVTIDNKAVGRLAAEHLINEGYHHFAFHTESRVFFARQRLEGFKQRLAEMNRTCEVFDTAPHDGQDRTSFENRQATIEWLHALPKPTGLFTHNDGRASMLLDICRDIGITVPEQIGVLGMDNDLLLSETSEPTLSSVDPASDLVGYRAAELLVELIKGREPPAKPIFVPPRGIVVRQSTKPVFVDDQYLAEAVAYIRAHATDPLTIEALLDQVPLSRRSLERRFRDRLGRSPGDEIRRVQMEKARSLLIETDHTLTKIAAAVGYNQFRNFATAFRRDFGSSPSAYRKTFRMH